jgi:hypothetical protein
MCVCMSFICQAASQNLPVFYTTEHDCFSDTEVFFVFVYSLSEYLLCLVAMRSCFIILQLQFIIATSFIIVTYCINFCPIFKLLFI